MTVDGVAIVEVTRTLADGTVETGGTARAVTLFGEVVVEDFRGPNGEQWALPPGASFELQGPVRAVRPRPRGLLRRLFDRIPWR
jgi:hypothetical protein